MRKKGSKLTGIIFLIFSLMVVGVSAYVYQQAQMTVTQNIVEIATITLKNSDLGDINEGETIVYTESEVANLGAAVTITTTDAPVYLHFTSDLDSLDPSYATYEINILYDTVPPGGTGSGTAGTLTLAAPDLATPITLDVTGTWVFDLSVDTTADSVTADTPTTVTITVGAEST
ncbi:hypothetical protein ACFL0D_03150 [Thermoproteota archaeon]